jgi:uncharacterized protein YyaL (SSP411 family)
MEAAVGFMKQAPTAMGQMLLAVDIQLGPTYELVFAGGSDDPALVDLRRQYLPGKVLAGSTGEPAPELLRDLLAGKSKGAEPVLYVCEGFTCQVPAEGRAAITAALKSLQP